MPTRKRAAHIGTDHSRRSAKPGTFLPVRVLTGNGETMPYYGCLYCDKTFEGKEPRDRHIAAEHGEDRFYVRL